MCGSVNSFLVPLLYLKTFACYLSVKVSSLIPQVGCGYHYRYAYEAPEWKVDFDTRGLEQRNTASDTEQHFLTCRKALTSVIQHMFVFQVGQVWYKCTSSKAWETQAQMTRSGSNKRQRGQGTDKCRATYLCKFQTNNSGHATLGLYPPLPYLASGSLLCLPWL